MITKTCPACQEDFNPYKDNPRAICCSRGCSNTYRARNKPKVFCALCATPILRPGKQRGERAYCDKECEAKHRQNRVTKSCEICGKEFRKSVSQMGRFCSKPCSYIGHKRSMVHRSPQWRSYGECALIVLLRRNFPSLKILPNDRTQLEGFEIDIFLPELNAGIEFNGPHHFKPVYGEKVFQKTKNADKAKRAIACRKGIRIIEANCLKSISWTSKTIVYDLFTRACDELGIVPTLLFFTPEEVFSEKGKTPTNYKPYTPV